MDCVYHLAARVRVPESIHYPSEYNEVNVGGTVALMQAMRDTGVHRVVLTSSGAIYGEQDHQPIRESQTPHPDSPYGVSKIAAEYYVATLGTLYDIETVSLRIFNTYGPGQDLPPSYPPVIPQVLRQAQTGGSIVIFGDGSQPRDFVFVDDVVEAMVLAGTARSANRTVINIGSGREVSISELAKHVIRATEKRASTLYNPAASGGVSRLVADVSLARELLGWMPRTTLEEGLRLTLARDARFQTS